MTMIQPDNFMYVIQINQIVLCTSGDARQWQIGFISFERSMKTAGEVPDEWKWKRRFALLKTHKDKQMLMIFLWHRVRG